MKPTIALVVAVLAVTALLTIPGFSSIAIGVAVCVGIATIVDAWQVLQRERPSIRRNIAPSLAIRQSVAVRLTIENDSNLRLRVTVNDRCPLELNPTGLPATFSVPPDQSILVEYTVRPTMRGDFHFPYVDVAVDSALGLWQRMLHIPCEASIRVYPDFSQITKYLQLLLVHQTNQIGLRKLARRGEGLEFLQLREYRQGDSLSRIDWKATSKRRDLISREFEDERAQQLVFLVDTGQRLHSHDGEVSLMDRTLDAMILLSYIALRQGDKVAISCFGQDNRWIPSVAGLSAVSSLLHLTYDLRSGPVASDYIEAAEEALLRQPKRSLMVLLTSLRDDDHEVTDALRLLSTRHSVILASLRERSIDESMYMDVHNIDHALTVLGAAKYIKERQEVIQQCRRATNVVLEALPSDLHVKIVNAYWQIKRAGQL